MNATTTPAGLTVTAARGPEDLVAAQRLRHEVFARELGARVLGAEQGLDLDRFDAHCDHLLVREGESGRAVACLRLLDGAGAMAAGGFYSQQEFDLTRVLTLPGRLLEVGRVCVAPDRRGGGALTALWSGLAREAARRRADYLIGCASVPFDPETETLAPLRESLRARWTPDVLRAFPRRPAPRDADGPAREARLPALLAAYLRFGARVAGEPGWDPDFGTADFLVVLPVEKLTERRFFSRRAEAASCAS